MTKIIMRTRVDLLIFFIGISSLSYRRGRGIKAPPPGPREGSALPGETGRGRQTRRVNVK